VVWSSEGELHFYNLDSRSFHTVIAEPCISSAADQRESPRRARPEDLAISEDIVIFSCSQRMGYDIERDVFFPLPLYTEETRQLTAQRQIGFTGWVISGDQLVWVLTESSFSPQEHSRIFTAQIERSP
jgi:hypothetical protein